MLLLNRFQDTIKKQNLFSPKDKLLLAVSGGVDSVVLTDLCHHAGFDFAIAHCNFQLRGEQSNGDERFVKELAARYKVEFIAKTFDTRAIAVEEKKSIEETARDLRYKWFAEIIDNWPEGRNYYILTGHHADDNIETVVMNFFRGTGLKGIRGIQPKNGRIIRPLLFARRREIEDYAWYHELKFVMDSTNLEDVYTRNFFRNRTIPEIQKIFPGTDKNILNNIERFKEAEELYRQAIAMHKKKLLELKGNEVHIPVQKLKKSEPLQSIVYEIVKDFGFTAHQAGEVIALLDSENGKYVASGTHRVIKNRNWLIIAPLQHEESQTILIESADEKVVFDGGKLQFEITSNQQPATSNQVACLDVKEIRFPLLLRKWKTGDYFYPLGMKKKKKLARFFIDQKLSKTQKENVWVIESNKKILWLVGHRIDDRFKLTEKTKDILKISISHPSQTG